jgi:hypothetical protein
MPIFEKQVKVSQALFAFIRNRHGFVVSQPNLSPMRFEVTPPSSLPDELTRLGYTVRHIGATERLLPASEGLSEHSRKKKITRDQVGITQVECFELDMPVIR